MNRGIVLSTMALAMVMMCLFVNTDCRAATDDEQAVKESATRFYEALNTLFTGDAGPMKNVWSHANDVTYMGPGGGFQVGWKKIAAEWDSQAAKKLGGKVEPRDVHFAVTPALAVVYCYEMGENVVNGKPQPVQLRASTVFRKENGTWKVIAHQTDTLPYLKP